jgi:hypothetical protein
MPILGATTEEQLAANLYGAHRSRLRQDHLVGLSFGVYDSCMRGRLSRHGRPLIVSSPPTHVPRGDSCSGPEHELPVTGKEERLMRVRNGIVGFVVGLLCLACLAAQYPQQKQPYVQIAQWKNGKMTVVPTGSQKDGWVYGF